MAEEYHQGGICGGNSWWSSASRHALVAASPCSVGGFSDLHMGISSGFGCPNDMDMIKSSSRSSTTCGGFGLNNSSSPSSTLPSDLNQALFLRSASGRGESNFHNNSMLPMNNNQAFSIVDQTSSSSSGFAITSSSSSPPNNNNNNNNSYDGGFPSQLLQSLYDPEVVNVGVVPHHQPQLRSLFNNGSTYSNSPENYGTLSSNDLIISSSPAAASSTSCWPRYSPSSCLRPSLQTRQQQQPAGGGLHFSNINTPFWNAPPAAHDVRSSSTGLFPSLCQPQYTAPSTAAIYNEHKPVTTSSNFTKPNTNEDVHDSSSSTVKKSGGGGSFCNSTEPVFKRARIETPSPLPTFKVRKEKLGDRITALQQLVSPFGKTDTASVLHEAIEYIKFLHDQVGVLSTPYMKNGASPMQPQQVGCDVKSKETEQGGKKDLKSRGLCLVPISSTFPVANETTADFWTPTFGATSFR